MSVNPQNPQTVASFVLTPPHLGHSVPRSTEPHTSHDTASGALSNRHEGYRVWAPPPNPRPANRAITVMPSKPQSCAGPGGTIRQYGHARYPPTYDWPTGSELSGVSRFLSTPRFFCQCLVGRHRWQPVRRQRSSRRLIRLRRNSGRHAAEHRRRDCERVVIPAFRGAGGPRLRRSKRANRLKLFAAHHRRWAPATVRGLV